MRVGTTAPPRVYKEPGQAVELFTRSRHHTVYTLQDSQTLTRLLPRSPPKKNPPPRARGPNRVCPCAGASSYYFRCYFRGGGQSCCTSSGGGKSFEARLESPPTKTEQDLVEWLQSKPTCGSAVPRLPQEEGFVGDEGQGAGDQPKNTSRTGGKTSRTGSMPTDVPGHPCETCP
ncbi:hypothetical protein GWK47_022998 [Chionoecetes opilio]|uniref:Uncharacterized protein n=1 Tax=Chionoecetes opilio TaxID=41210 RepID=A0A8J4XMB7_CHIOP|nr:hypothetical protein GWK47_022998 [Chionoecetes opilio]